MKTERNVPMRNFETIQATGKEESEEIKRIFDNQTKFLKGIIVFAIVQYVVLLAIL